MFQFDDDEDEIACKDLILAGKICKHCGHSHSKTPDDCGCMEDRLMQWVCTCKSFESFVSTLKEVNS